MSIVGPDFDTAHWEDLQHLFDEFEPVPVCDREREFERRSLDLRLRSRLRSLFAAAAQSGGQASMQPPRSPPCESIGPYRLIREIGAGGNDTVYLAERVVDAVPLRSALKILAPHAVGEAFVERFHREQVHLATLDHPNITRLLDAGWTAGGNPYLVVEYVDGMQLDQYCDSRRLGIAERLRLFLQICDAVSHAHRSLIVHLDLKPSNILVSGGGSVKLLDFGTSKLIRSDGKSTSTIMVTPSYSSPEQLLNQPVGTASDVYGLGAVLFELLAGKPPFGYASAAVRMEGAVRDIEPQSASKAVSATSAGCRGLTEARLRQVLKGDLNAICARCLRPQPGSRYSSVEKLSDDLRRHLQCKPVRARRQTVGYRCGRFLRRHRWSAIAACAVTCVVAGSVAYAWTQQRQALHEAERAVRMQSFLFGLFKMANPNYTAKPIATVPEFLRAGLNMLPQNIHDPADLREAQLALAESMYESGDYDAARSAFVTIIDSASHAGAVDNQTEAEAFAAMIDILQGRIDAGRRLGGHALRLARSPGVTPRSRVLATIFHAYNEDNNGYIADDNLTLLRAALEESHSQHLAARESAMALYYLASDLYLRGRGAEARPLFEQLLPLYADDPFALCNRSEIYAWLAWITNTGGDSEGSLPLFRQAYDGYVACSGAESRGALDQIAYWSDALIRTNRAAQAVGMIEAALPTWRRVLGGSSDQSEMLYYLARGYLALGRYAEAERTARELLLLIEGRLAPTDRNVGMAHMVLGQALVREHRPGEALPHARKAVDLLVASAVTPYGHGIGNEAVALAHEVDAALAAR
jgi:tetratricopeptide (TPR) repeat protein